jgi:hypothetical protein
VVGGERLGVAGVGGDHGEAVTGDGEEHVVGEPGVDHPEQVRLAALHAHPDGAGLGAREQVAGLAVDVGGVRRLDVAAGPHRVLQELVRVVVPPPLACSACRLEIVEINQNNALHCVADCTIDQSYPS